MVVVVVGGRPGLGWPESDRCLVFGQPEEPGGPARALVTEEPRLGPGDVGGVGVLQLHPDLVLRRGSWGAGRYELGSG